MGGLELSWLDAHVRSVVSQSAGSDARKEGRGLVKECMNGPFDEFLWTLESTGVHGLPDATLGVR